MSNFVVVVMKCVFSVLYGRNDIKFITQQVFLRRFFGSVMVLSEGDVWARDRTKSARSKNSKVV